MKRFICWEISDTGKFRAVDREEVFRDRVFEEKDQAVDYCQRMNRDALPTVMTEGRREFFEEQASAAAEMVFDLFTKMLTVLHMLVADVDAGHYDGIAERFIARKVGFLTELSKSPLQHEVHRLIAQATDLEATVQALADSVAEKDIYRSKDDSA